MAVADIPSELIVNARSSWDQFLWLLPGSGLYRWDKNIGYMYAYGAIPVDGQGLPPGPPIPNPDAPFSLPELNYLNSFYIRTINGLKPDASGDVALTVVPAPPEGGWSATDFTAAVQASIAKADTASQPGHTHTAAQISDATSTGRTLLTAAGAAAARAATGAASATLVLTAGAGLTGGGDLSAGRSFALTTAAQASLARADTAVQPASLSAYVRTVNGAGPDANGNVAITIEGGGYVKPAGGIPSSDMTSAVQASLGKADTSSQPGHTHTASQISDASTVGRGILTAADSATARTSLGLGNVNNTADVDKPVSTAQANADTSTLNSAKTYTDSKFNDTGWTTITAPTGYTGGNLAYRALNGILYIRGRLTINTGSIVAATGLISIPATYAPKTQQRRQLIILGAGGTIRLSINTDGTIDLSIPSGNYQFVDFDGTAPYPYS